MPRANHVWNALWRCAFRIVFLGYCTVNFFRPPATQGDAVAVWHNGRVLLVRNSYRRNLNLPGGMARRGEEPVDAAVRELAEELGIAVAPEELTLACETSGVFEFRHDHTYIFEVEVTSVPKVRYDGREVVWAEFVPAKQALGLPLIPPVQQYLACR